MRGFVLYRWLLLVGCLALGVLSGCVCLPEKEYANFTPLPAHARRMNQFTIRWEVRDDAHQYCEQKHIDKGGRVEGMHVACAIWSVSQQTCRIVTSTQVSHAVLGNELRHCFEGHFHD